MKPWVFDITGVGGAAMIVIGVGMVHVPAAVVVAGGMTLYASILGVKRWQS